MRYRDLPQFTRSSEYRVDVPWGYLETVLSGYADDAKSSGIPFEMDPDFQRGHVWSREKQVRYVEFVLRGGRSSCDIYWNCPGWNTGSRIGGRFVLVDGKQRVEAVRAFMRGDFPAFGTLVGDFTDKLPIHSRFKFHVNDLSTEAEVLQWYLDLNDGGVVHTDDELNRVRTLLAAAKAMSVQKP